MAPGPSLDAVAGTVPRPKAGRPISSIPATSHCPVVDDPDDALPGEGAGDDVAGDGGVRPATAVDGDHVTGPGQVGIASMKRMSPGRVQTVTAGPQELRSPGDPAEPGPDHAHRPAAAGGRSIVSTTVHCCACHRLMPR
jgi:hypothetical protein